MARLVNVLAQAGRPLEAQHLPMAKKWAELEVLRVDYFNALQAAATERDSKLVEQYLSVCRLQVAVERSLGMTPSVKLGMEPDDPVSQIVRYRQQLALEAGKANGS